MAVLFRSHASRTYALASGALFILSALLIAILAVIRPMSGIGRAIGFVLAAILLSRGLFRLRQARTNLSSEATEQPTDRESSSR